MLKTTSFIGSDKNAGKTTSFNFTLSKMIQGSSKICITSIGLNGEVVDNFDGGQKPNIQLTSGLYFITSTEQLKNHSGKYSIIETFLTPIFSKNYVLAMATTSFKIILEGPNNRNELLKIKKNLVDSGQIERLLIDGSIDRQFLASPKISDSFFFALLISQRREQLQKAKDLLYPLSMTVFSNKKIIQDNIDDTTKSLLFVKDECIYKSTEIPFLDKELKETIKRYGNTDLTMYINGALTKSLHDYVAPYNKLTIVIDNFTLYHNVTTSDSYRVKAFHPTIELYNAINVERIFLFQQVRKISFELPSKIPVTNIFREDIREIRI